MTPPTVNAYYDPQMNNINFPAGILQPPFFDKSADDAVNFGGIGVVIGHELTHGFDDQGRQFDATGNLRDWWTAKDAKAFEQRAACVADEYSNFTVAPGVNVNGKLTLGENTADNGGVRIALMALMDTLGKAEAAKKIDGFTPEQRFFLAFAQVWCSNDRPEAQRLQVSEIRTRPRSSASTASCRTCRSSRRRSPARWARPWRGRTRAGSGRARRHRLHGPEQQQIQAERDAHRCHRLRPHGPVDRMQNVENGVCIQIGCGGDAALIRQREAGKCPDGSCHPVVAVAA